MPDASTLPRPHLALDIKREFPVLNRELPGAPGESQGIPLHYLDSAATTQKPVAVIDAMDRFYRESYGTVRRGVYRLSEKATAAYEGTRKQVAALLNAGSDREIIYTSGTTQGINLVAYSWGGKFLKAGDEIILSQIEHHANIVPWQIIAERTGAIIKVIPVDESGTLDLGEYRKLLSDKTRMVAPWGRSIRSRRSSAWRIRPAPWRLSTGRNPSPICRWTCATWTPTSTPSRGIRCSGLPASGSCTASWRCSRPCPPTREAAT
jgi:hypothetical protein